MKCLRSIQGEDLQPREWFGHMAKILQLSRETRSHGTHSVQRNSVPVWQRIAFIQTVCSRSNMTKIDHVQGHSKLLHNIYSVTQVALRNMTKKKPPLLGRLLFDMAFNLTG